MKRYHQFMLTGSLLASAAGFKLASLALGWATYHKSRYNLLEDERITSIMGLKSAPIVHRSIKSPNTWMDAMPDRCPLCDNAETCAECQPYRSK